VRQVGYLQRSYLLSLLLAVFLHIHITVIAFSLHPARGMNFLLFMHLLFY